MTMSVYTSDTNEGVGRPTANQVDLALLVIRIAGALTFLYHGSAILFGAFGGPGLSGFSEHAHMPFAVALLVGLAQFCGGLAFATGVLTRLGGVAISAVMLGAIFLVHISKGFDVTKGGIEFALTQLLIAVALTITGAGRYSLANLLPKRSESGSIGRTAGTHA